MSDPELITIHKSNWHGFRDREQRYFERAKRVEGNLADIRAKLGVSNQPNRVTLQRIDDLQEAAANWFASRRHLEED